MPDYKFASFYVGESSDEEIQEALDSKFLQQIRTVVKGIDDTSDVIGYINNQVTKQNALIDGYEHTFRQNLRIRSVETALGEHEHSCRYKQSGISTVR